MANLTMKDIAERAGVSLTTVSRALQNRPEISVATTQRIKEIAAELGYVHNSVAKSLRSQKTRIVGLVVADNANPFFGLVVKGIEETLSASGYELILCNSEELYRKEIRCLRVLLGRQVDGILITPAQAQREDIVSLMESKIPVTLVGRRFPDLTVDYVIADDEGGAYAATEHLIRLGHQDILFLNAAGYISSAVEREAGYTKALTAFGVDPGQDSVRHCNPTYESAYNAVSGILVEERRFSAVFCFNDLMAMGAIKALREAEVRVPEDVSVVGFDDIEFSALLEPPLTTIHVPRRALGIEAAKILLDRIDGPHSVMQTVIPTELIVRGSTARRKTT